eukprot:TRINITY_DN21401_c0_g1_i3.p1 TRINITY_DN21401_c0_g1~~TRINITY_DN21401_c0_g1_i3.p1  ORF type:complete len:115 (-),score=15.74 TRINITY_DN21401_c0_g1_i3:161-505(-)
MFAKEAQINVHTYTLMTLDRGCRLNSVFHAYLPFTTFFFLWECQHYVVTALNFDCTGTLWSVVVTALNFDCTGTLWSVGALAAPDSVSVDDTELALDSKSDREPFDHETDLTLQ